MAGTLRNNNDSQSLRQSASGNPRPPSSEYVGKCHTESKQSTTVGKRALYGCYSQQEQAGGGYRNTAPQMELVSSPASQLARVSYARSVTRNDRSVQHARSSPPTRVQQVSDPPHNKVTVPASRVTHRANTQRLLSATRRKRTKESVSIFRFRMNSGHLPSRFLDMLAPLPLVN